MTAPEADRVLQVHDAENLHAAVVETCIDWRKALVEAVIRAELSGAATTRLLGHELCVRRLAGLLCRWRARTGRAASGRASAPAAA